MPAIRPLPVFAIMLALVAVSGCASWNDRYASQYDPVMRFLGAEPQDLRDWPSRNVPDLPAMQTEQIPDRRPPLADPPIGWPPLSPALESAAPGPTDTVAAGHCSGRCDSASPLAPAAAPALALRSEHPLPR